MLLQRTADIAEGVGEDMREIYLYVHTYISTLRVCMYVVCVCAWVCVVYAEPGTYLQLLVNLRIRVPGRASTL